LLLRAVEVGVMVIAERAAVQADFFRLRIQLQAKLFTQLL
jgi:hypothetical protein